MTVDASSHVVPSTLALSRTADDDSDCEDPEREDGSPTPDEPEGVRLASGSNEEGSAGSPKNGAAAVKKKVKKRNRKPSSCGPCRRKKLRCDRQAPCGACVLRGEPHLCSWEDAVPLLLGRADNDSADLREQVDRLQGLVDILIRTPHSYPHLNPHLSGPPSYHSPSELSENSGSLSAGAAQGRGRQSSLVSQFEHTDEPNEWAMAHNVPAASPPIERHDLKGSDLAEALSHLAITHVTGRSETIRSPSATIEGPVRLDDAKAYLNLPSRFGLAGDPFVEGDGAVPVVAHARYQASRETTEKLSSLPSASAPANGLASVLASLPTDLQAKSALGYYTRYVDWYLHPLHLPTFWKQFEAMKRWKSGDEDPFFLATYLAVSGIGIAMQPPARALRDGIGSAKQRDELADKFLQASMTALTVGQFLDNPSAEAIRALLVLNTHYVFMDSGEHTGSGMGLLSLAVQIALQLGLHRDPDKTAGRFGPVETEERRRLFWTLCSFECLASSALGRTYSIFDLNNVDTKFPRDLDDDEITPSGIARRPNPDPAVPPTTPRETVMTSLLIRMRVGVVAKRISDRAFGIRPVSYATVMELDRELRKLEGDLPPHYHLRYDEPTGTFALPAAGAHITSLRFYMIHISLQQEYMRLHRPFLVKATTSSEMAQSRAICVRAARVILAIQRQPPMQSDWAGLLYKSISAAIVLAIDILQDPYSPFANVYRAEIQAIVTTLNRFSKTSTLCRKGVKVVMFLLDRDAINTRVNEDRAQKKVRTSAPAGLASLGEAYHSGSSSGTSPASVYAPVPGLPEVHGDDGAAEDDESRPRKLPRPQRPANPSPGSQRSQLSASQSPSYVNSFLPSGSAGAGGHVSPPVLPGQMPPPPPPQAGPATAAARPTMWLDNFTAASSGFGPAPTLGRAPVPGPPTARAHPDVTAYSAALAAASNMGAFVQHRPPIHPLPPSSSSSSVNPSLLAASRAGPAYISPPTTSYSTAVPHPATAPAGFDSVPASSIPEPSPMDAAPPPRPQRHPTNEGLPASYDFDFSMLAPASQPPATKHTDLAGVGGDWSALEQMGIIGGTVKQPPVAWSSVWLGEQYQ